MNKFIITITAAIMMSLSGAGMAQGFDGDRGGKTRHHKRGMPDMPVVEQLMRAVRHLDLTDEQKVEIKTAMKAMKGELRSRMSEKKTINSELKALIKADDYDGEAVAILADKEGKLAADRIMIVSKSMSDVLAALTDEQRVKLDEVAAQRQERRKEKRES